MNTRRRNFIPVITFLAGLLLVMGLARADQILPIPGSGGLNVQGSIVQVAIGTPSAPTVTNVGVTGSTSMIYYCVAFDGNGTGAANTHDTVQSSSTTNTTSNATLTAANYNIITCGGKVGAAGYKVLKADTSHILGFCYTHSMSGASCTVTDNSTTAGTAYTAQTVDQTGPGASTVPGNGKGLVALIRQTTGCSTSGVIANACGEPTITGLPFPDTNYNVECTCVGTPTGVPGAIYVAKTAATAGMASTAQVFVNAQTAATASCVEMDCRFDE